jgi:hypothetical protein
MRSYLCSILVVFALFLVTSVPTAQAATSSTAAPSLETFLTSLSTPGTAPVGVPQPRWTTDCYATYQGCLAGCGGNADCQLLCQCAYYDCRGMDRPTFCL